MAPSFTVENYLKAIYQAQTALSDADALVQMGHLAASMHVVPGTATTMVKALAEAGLARYEPYVGVRLTPAGEKLAALVLRRHRLIELFLVKVMDMSWTEVHDEAEQLEHAASDRLIARMDEMLGRPEVDPHGDPIPGPEGFVAAVEYDDLLTCPVGTPVTVSRLSDQDRGFLEFAEQHDLKPGDVLRVEERDKAGDSVQLRTGQGRSFTIGARAASKILVRAASTVALLLCLCGSAFAQAPSTAPDKPEPFKITDNSFLVEEAFNQEAGVVQNIFGAMRSQGAWASTFTQEWPAPSQTHQLSYTVAFLNGDEASGFGDTLINYRYQAAEEGPGRVAMSPRVSVVLPTGNRGKGLGDGSAGLQFNLPVSKQLNDWYVHWNGGLTWLPKAQGELRGDASDERERHNLVSPFIAASAIYRLEQMLNLMLETVVSFDQSAVAGGTTRTTTYTLSPGFRGGWNVGEAQLITGLALPISWSDGERDTGAFLYLSYELPFKK
jgi:DtxR family transcriptional regulator, Mn-dependent transcriptional regulator